ncbi:glycine cleavage system protein GcvH [Desulfofundulus sp.]|uniref:glycine cleavage system protein GcvH n=1 Tax=Desulfofundulus sp. TaxID=2282750 RepID=UPI003C787D07
MANSYAVLPCNGLDKSAGCIAREIALLVAERSESELLCPVFYRISDARYNKIANEKPLLVIDGCSTRCASKLAAEKGLKIAKKITVAEEAKKRNVTLGKSLRLGEAELALASEIADELLQEEKDEKVETTLEDIFSGIVYDYEIYKKDKFIFRVPRSGFYFNENDCWAYVSGNRARVGVTDYVQQSLSDIMFFNPPEVGVEVEQFGELGAIESAKAVFEVVSPVSGKVVRVNEELVSSPELINEDPYKKGWIAELELTDFESDRELLLDFDKYFEILKRKVDEFHV